MPTTSGDDTQVRPFAAVLQELNKGNVHTELSQTLHDLIAAVRDTGKKGTLVLKLDVRPIKPGQTDTLQAVATVNSTLPQPEAQVTMFFVDGTGNLTRDDPDKANQLPLREVANQDWEGNNAA